MTEETKTTENTHEERERVARPEEVLEELEERSEGTRPQPLRCRSGISSKEMPPCPRDATTWMFPEDRDYPLCEEHARLYELGNEVHYRDTACHVTLDWLRLARAWGHEDLERMAENAHEEAKLEFLKAQAKADLAEEIADAPRKGDERPNLTREQDEKLRELMRRGDSLNDAYTTVEDAPPELLRDEARERILAVLASERDKGWKEAHRYKEELGLEVRTSEDRQRGRGAGE
jgi:hypothetical protein